MRYDLEVESDAMGDLGFIEPLSAVKVVAS
jgi:hypothetical protein